MTPTQPAAPQPPRLDALLAALPAAIQHWTSRDPVLADLARQTQVEPWPAARDPFSSLCVSIIHQQVSLAAGRTIYGRFAALVGDVTPANVMAVGEGIGAAGLSRQKTGYILDLAASAGDGTLDGLDSLSDAEVTARLTQVKGIGVWSAKMFLLFQLGRLDVCPWEDLGVRLAVARFYGVPEAQAARWLRDEAQPRWAPYNSVAARVLWAARRDEK